ncbi:hypothetical protein EMIT0P218_20125 [Pseudomonas sp. IT-P218]
MYRPPVTKPARIADKAVHLSRPPPIHCRSQPAGDGVLTTAPYLTAVPDLLWEPACWRWRPHNHPVSHGRTRSTVGASLLAMASSQLPRISRPYPIYCGSQPAGDGGLTADLLFVDRVHIHSCGNGHLWFRPYGESLGKTERRPALSNQGLLPLTFGASLRLGMPSLRSCSVGPPRWGRGLLHPGS